MRGRLTAAAGIFLLTAAAYILMGPGRIDIIDGQYRFEVAKNLGSSSGVQVNDRFLTGASPGRDGKLYSPYGLSGSLVAAPFVGFANLADLESVDRQQFFFSFVSAIFGAGTAAVLFIFYTGLGVPSRRAVAWTLVASFTTLAFPASTTVFDQAQHAFFVAVACLASFLSAKRNSLALAALGGCALAVLVNFQETYALMIPTLGLAALAPAGAQPAERRRGLARYAVFVVVGSLGVVVWAAFNYYRFGSWFFAGKGGNHPAPFSNPIVGLLGLTVSPGKSIILYSPVTAAAVFGLRRLAQTRLGAAVVTACAAHLTLISTLSFYGGDWCWGPRYFVPILPLLALGLPWFGDVLPWKRVAIRSLVVVSLLVQLLGLSLDHHRFFYARSLQPFFWATDPTFYFRDSALLARPGELIASFHGGVPSTARTFRPGPYPELLTYAIFGGWGAPDLPLAVWMNRYSVFWLPRPWPLWMRAIPEERRPIDVDRGVMTVLMIASAGIGLTLAGARRPLVA